jgi:hypothetical protein
MARSNGRFSLGRENAFEPERTPCNILRIMNASDIFPFESTGPLLASACRHVVDGGLLILGDARTRGSEMATTIFQRRGRHFVAIRDIGDGYERKQAVLELVLSD